MSGRVFVFEAYVPNGGTLMAYHLGRMLNIEFGYDCHVVGKTSPDHEIFQYDPVFPLIDIDTFWSTVCSRDILIANPSFSSFLFGLKCPALKIMYAQGFTTFGLLDCAFDHYVSVSKVVHDRRTHDLLLSVYGIDTRIIPAFIGSDSLPSAPDWEERPARKVLVSAKGTHRDFLLQRLREGLAARGIDAQLELPGGPKQNHADFVASLGRFRYFLTLSEAEGFGLVPLEAMAMGTAVVGFDGFGGRDYMVPGVNCAVSRYPRIEKVVDSLAALLENPDRARHIAAAGRRTARDPVYSYEAFRAAWHAEFSRLLSCRAAG